MASKNIKGITIEIDGNATGLDKALKGVNGTSVKLNSELGQVNKLLKFDPSNATGLAQKQELLTKSIENTSDKLNQLKSAQSQVDAQYKSGNIGEEQYRAFQREIATTEQSLNGYKSQLSGLQSEQEKLGQNTKRLNTFFEASGKSINDFSDILGTRLVNSIKNGTATSDQLEMALNKIGKEALGAGTDLNEMKQSLDKVDDGGSIKGVKNDLESLKTTSNSTDEELGKLGNGITSGNMMQATQVLSDVGEKIKEFAGAAQDAFRDIDDGMDNYTTKTGKSSESIKGAFETIATSMPIEDLGELGNVLGEVDTQFGLTGDKLQNTSEYFLKFSEINKADVSESVKNTKDVLEQFNLTADKAPSVLDAITKTSQETGTSVDDLFSIVKENSSTFESLGFDVGTSVNMIGKLDQQGVNAGAVIKALTKSQTSLASESAKSAKEVGDLEQKLQEQNKQLSNTKSGTPAYKSLSESIDQTKVKLEEALTTQDKFSKGFGANLSDLQKGIKGAADEQDAINQASEIFGKKQAPQIVKAIRDGKLNLEEFGKAGKDSIGTVGKTFDDTLDPIDRQRVAMQGVKIAMGEIGAAIAEGIQPILDSLIPMLKNIAKAFGELPSGVKTFIVVIGTLLTVFSALAPFIAAMITIFSAISATVVAAGGAMAFLTGTLLPIIGVIVAIIAVIALIVLAIKNWGKIVDWLKGVWGGLKDWFSKLWDGIKEVTSNVWKSISDFFSSTWKSIVDTAKSIFTPIIQVFQLIFMTIASVIQGVWLFITSILQAAWNIIVALATAVFTPIAEFFSGIWDSISNKISEVWNAVTGFLSGVWNSVSQTAIAIFTPIVEFFSGIWTGISTTISNVWNSVVSFLSGIWGSISATASSVFSSIANFLSGIWSGISSAVSGAWNGIASFIGGAINGISSNVSSVFNSIKNVVSSVWDGIRSAIETPMNAAKDTVSNVINSIKGFFSGLNLKFPKIEMPKLPHFSIQGEFSLKNMTVPHLGVDWFANGGILTKPTIFGQNGNSLMVGGEAGKEAVAPLSDLMAYVESAVANQIGDMSSNFAQMIQLLSIIANKELALDFPGGDLARISYKETEKLILRSNV